MRYRAANTHANKAASYNIGRPEYPAAFFDYFYGELGVTNDAVIADIGAGTGKVAARFLSRGNRVFAIEPDTEMAEFLKVNLDSYTNCTILKNTAESTGIISNSVDIIFCGNSYM